MCGRFSLNATLEDLYIALKIKARFNIEARYNIAPGQPILTLRNHPVRVAREFAHLGWGLIPGWMKQAPTTGTMINARAETIAEKPSFKAAYARRRCLIPATGFYEWKGAKAPKQPYYIYLKASPVFAFAGIWEHWTGHDGSEVETAAIITAEAAPSLEEIHHRMPVIVREDDIDTWMRGEVGIADVVQKNIEFSYRPVSTLVNNVANDDARLIEEHALTLSPQPRDLLG